MNIILRISILMLTMLIMIGLTACSNKNSGMYKIEKKQKEVEQHIQNGYGNVEAQIDPAADKDKKLGTKHIKIIEGVPYAELDSKEQSNEDSTVAGQYSSIFSGAEGTKNKTNQTLDKESDIDNEAE